MRPPLNPCEASCWKFWASKSPFVADFSEFSRARFLLAAFSWKPLSGAVVSGHGNPVPGSMSKVGGGGPTRGKRLFQCLWVQICELPAPVGGRIAQALDIDVPRRRPSTAAVQGKQGRLRLTCPLGAAGFRLGCSWKGADLRHWSPPSRARIHGRIRRRAH